jgi:hypothetical protein
MKMSLKIFRGETNVSKDDWDLILRKGCHQGHYNSDFTYERWPFELETFDEEEWEIVPHKIIDGVTIKEGLRILTDAEKRGELRLPKGSRMVLQYISENSELQRYHPLILPMKTENEEGIWGVPVFDYFEEDPRFCYIVVVDINEIPHSDSLWLVLRKKAPK